MSMLIVTHEIGLASEAAGRMIMLDEEVIIDECAPVEFLERPRRQRAKACLSQILL